MQRTERIEGGNVQWSRPMDVKTLSQIFDVHRNTMSKWLKKQIIQNQQLSPRRWRIATFELPNAKESEKHIENLYNRAMTARRSRQPDYSQLKKESLSVCPVGPRWPAPYASHRK
jgi:hypothetical protein